MRDPSVPFHVSPPEERFAAEGAENAEEIPNGLGFISALSAPSAVNDRDSGNSECPGFRERSGVLRL